MRERTVLRFALWSGASALIAALLLLPVAASWGGTVVRWSLLGWLVTAVAGVALPPPVQGHRDDDVGRKRDTIIVLDQHFA